MKQLILILSIAFTSCSAFASDEDFESETTSLTSNSIEWDSCSLRKSCGEGENECVGYAGRSETQLSYFRSTCEESLNAEGFSVCKCKRRGAHYYSQTDLIGCAWNRDRYLQAINAANPIKLDIDYATKQYKECLKAQMIRSNVIEPVLK